MAGTVNVDYQYKHFKATVPERKIFVGIVDQQEWRYYDTGPKTGLPPLICLGGVAATSDIFYKQLLSLSTRGYRVLAMDAPAIWTQEKWVKGFDHFLDALRIHHVHLYGTSLGGFLFQLYAAYRPRRVLSLLLSNTFLDTRAFHTVFGPWASVLPWAPDFMLKKLVLSGFKDGPQEPLIADSIDFVVARMDEKLSRAELASRLSLNTQLAASSPVQLLEAAITIMDCNDFASVPGPLRDALYQRYPEARRAFLKSGGDFPFLSRADEVNLHLLLHLRRVGAQHQGLQDEELLQRAAEEATKSFEVASSSVSRSMSNATSTSTSRLQNASSETGLGVRRVLEFVEERPHQRVTPPDIQEEPEVDEVDETVSADADGIAKFLHQVTLGDGSSPSLVLGGNSGDPLGVSMGHKVSEEERPDTSSVCRGGELVVDKLIFHADVPDHRVIVGQADADETVDDISEARQGSWSKVSPLENGSIAGALGPSKGDELPFHGSNGEAQESEPQITEEVAVEVTEDISVVKVGAVQDIGSQAREWLRGVEEQYEWESSALGETRSQARDWLRDVEKDHQT